ncbi:MAG: hypothetical protein HYU74_00175 [Dechloromonas sp.]|nr:hypothetical protein [Dechloromonas sp.]
MANISTEATETVAGVFKQLVLQHLDEFDESDWQVFRQIPLSIPDTEWMEPDYEPSATREKFVRENLFYINMRPADYISVGEHIEIAKINDQPLIYFPNAGVYAWSSANQPSTMMIWLSWPAEPPGW